MRADATFTKPGADHPGGLCHQANTDAWRRARAVIEFSFVARADDVLPLHQPGAVEAFVNAEFAADALTATTFLADREPLVHLAVAVVVSAVARLASGPADLADAANHAVDTRLDTGPGAVSQPRLTLVARLIGCPVAIVVRSIPAQLRSGLLRNRVTAHAVTVLGTDHSPVVDLTRADARRATEKIARAQQRRSCTYRSCYDTCRRQVAGLEGG